MLLFFTYKLCENFSLDISEEGLSLFIFKEKMKILKKFSKIKISKFEKTLKTPKMIVTRWVFRGDFWAREARRKIFT